MTVRRVTIGDLASELQLSTSTVSRALSGSGYVAPKTRQRIESHAKRRGYVPDLNARSLRGGSSREIGLVVSSLEDPFYAQIVTGFELIARAKGYNVVLFLDHAQPEVELEVSKSLVSKGVSGVAITPVDSAATEYLLKHMPNLVQLDRAVSNRISTVSGDNAEGGNIAANCLLDHGHERIAFLIDHTQWATGRARYSGYEQALQASGLKVDPALVFELGDSRTEISHEIEKFIANYKDNGITAVLAANSVVGELFYSNCLDSGIAIPGDLSFIAYDDLPWTALVRPAVTVVSQQAAEMGRLAAETLIEMIDDERDVVLNRNVLIQPNLVMRGTVRRLV